MLKLNSRQCRDYWTAEPGHNGLGIFVAAKSSFMDHEVFNS